LKILVVFTGGTIGSVVNDGYISPSDNTRYQLIEKYNSLAKREVDFEYDEPYTLLSEDVTGEYLGKLGECLLAHKDKDYDGIIVTHGTDTVQYSAASMAYLLQGINKPVIFVSSNYVLDDPRANGLDNFAYAVEFIVNKQGTGVFAVYRNGDGVVYVHRGNRLLPHLPCDDNLYSVGDMYYGHYEKNRFVPNPNYRVTASDKKYEMSLPKKWNSGILRIFPYPGMEYPKLSEQTRAVILDSYHSGTICSITPGMKEFFATAKAKNIPVFLAGSNPGTDYESVKEWKELGVYTLPQASPIAMYIKLWMIMDLEGILDGMSVNDIMMLSVSEDF